MNISMFGAKMLSKTKFLWEKHGATALIVGGIVVGVAATVKACKSTLKVEEIVDNAKTEFEAIDAAFVEEKVINDNGVERVYSEQDRASDRKTVYVQSGIKLLKLYGPSLLMGCLSIVMIFAGNKMHMAQKAAITAALASVTNTLSTYRGNVVETLGTGADKYFSTGIGKLTATDGKIVYQETPESEAKEFDISDDPKKRHPGMKALTNGLAFSAVWNEETAGDFCTTNRPSDLIFLRSVLNNLQMRLETTDEPVWLDDALKAVGLGHMRTEMTRLLYWKPKSKGGLGFISFGIEEYERELAEYSGTDSAKTIAGGSMRSDIFLDFNCDGFIGDDCSIQYHKRPSAFRKVVRVKE